MSEKAEKKAAAPNDRSGSTRIRDTHETKTLDSPSPETRQRLEKAGWELVKEVRDVNGPTGAVIYKRALR